MQLLLTWKCSIGSTVKINHTRVSHVRNDQAMQLLLTWKCSIGSTVKINHTRVSHVRNDQAMQLLLTWKCSIGSTVMLIIVTSVLLICFAKTDYENSANVSAILYGAILVN